MLELWSLSCRQSSFVRCFLYLYQSISILMAICRLSWFSRLLLGFLPSLVTEENLCTFPVWVLVATERECHLQLRPVRAPGCNAPLIRWFQHYIYCLLVYLASPTYFLFCLLIFLTYLLPYLPFPLRIGPLHFQAGGHKWRPNLWWQWMIGLLDESGDSEIALCLQVFIKSTDCSSHGSHNKQPAQWLCLTTTRCPSLRLWYNWWVCDTLYKLFILFTYTKCLSGNLMKHWGWGLHIGISRELWIVRFDMLYEWERCLVNPKFH